MSLLSGDELAYMRETQAESRPTEALFRRKVTTRTPTGGQSVTHDEGTPVAVRIKSVKPTAVQAGSGAADDYQVKITMDLVTDVQDGDRIQVSPTEVYELTTDGVVDQWTTAQVVYARRVTHLSR